MPTGTPHPVTQSNSSGAPVPTFWVMARTLASLTERERITRIGTGFEPIWFPALQSTFGLSLAAVASLANISSSIIERRIKSNTPLDPVTSERIDRLAQLAVLAEVIFEDEEAAGDWITRPNCALGGEAPFALCKTGLGAVQARRSLHAIEWGGVA